MRLVLTALAYLITLAFVSVASFYLVIILAGPHGGLLPRPFEVVVFILGWLLVIVAPILVARLVWRRFSVQRPLNATDDINVR